jgi:hypothetical protein
MSTRKLSQISKTGLAPLVTLFALAMACPQARAGGKVINCTEAGLRAALFSGGTVTFACSGTIQVLGGTITVSSDTTIDGTGQTITINGGGVVQLFIVNTGVTLNLNQITVADGFVSDGNGGAVLNNGTLNVTNCTFQGNLAGSGKYSSSGGNGGAISNNDYLTVTNSAFENNTASSTAIINSANLVGLGGAIYNTNDAKITNSSFQGNEADSGGAIFSGSPNRAGVLIVNNSTFNNNQIIVDPGAAGPGLGGGIYNQAFITVVTNSTFFGNGGTNADGGNFYNCCNYTGTALLDNDTLDAGIAASGEGGNISNVNPGESAGNLFVENTIIANAASGMNCNGSYSNIAGNLLWPSSDSSCIGSYGNPMLGPLSYNGGPTQTMAIGPGSAALYTAIEKFCPPTDQRGVIRPQGPICDIGAFEYSTSLSMGNGIFRPLHLFADSLLSPAAAHNLRESVIIPLRQSLDPDLWGQDGNHVNGSEVFQLQLTVVQNLNQLLIDQRQLDYINNLVMADRTLATTAINDLGCNTIPNPSVGPTAQATLCSLAEAELAAGDKSAGIGDYARAITHYQNAWQFACQ